MICFYSSFEAPIGRESMRPVGRFFFFSGRRRDLAGCHRMSSWLFGMQVVERRKAAARELMASLKPGS